MAKKKKKGSAQPGVDPNEKRRERLEAKRAAKAAAEAAKRKREARERLIRRIAMVALFGVAVWFLFLRNATPSEINGHPINTFSTAGANQHTGAQVSYEDTPPVSGQHAALPADCGVHGQPIPDENMVHTFEHGSVGLLYAPNVDIEQIRALEEIVGEYDGQVFSMPYTGGMESPITIAAWGHTMELDEVEEDSIKQFIEEFRGGGDAPEASTPCRYQDSVPFEPEDPNAEATPGEEITLPPEDEATPEPDPSE